MVDLRALFETLKSPDDGASGGLRFETVAIPGSTKYHLGRTAAEEAALLIEADDASGESPPPIRLQSLVVYQRALCRVSSKGTQGQRLFTVLWYSGMDPELRGYFLGLIAPLILTLGDRPSGQRVADAVDALAELFRAMGRPPRKSIQGLWAELLLIAQAHDAVALARAWRVSPDDRYDFNAGAQRIEVKSASTSARRHHFSREQLRPPAETRVIIASVLTSRAPLACSIRVLLDRIQVRLLSEPELQARIYRVVAETLGSGLSAGLSEGYDELLARDSLRFIDHRDVPSVLEPVPPQVSEVRFVSDLSSVSPLTEPSVRAEGGIMAAALPG